jgi:hypothetical protein
MIGWSKLEEEPLMAFKIFRFAFEFCTLLLKELSHQIGFAQK